MRFVRTAASIWCRNTALSDVNGVFGLSFGFIKVFLFTSLSVPVMVLPMSVWGCFSCHFLLGGNGSNVTLPDNVKLHHRSSIIPKCQKCIVKNAIRDNDLHWFLDTDAKKLAFSTNS